MARLYSVNFICESLLGDGVALYEIAEGYVAVIRSIDVVAQNDGTDLTDSSPYWEAAINGTAFAGFGCPVPFAGTWSWRGHQVSPPGPSELEISTGGNTVTYSTMVSGYLLSLP